MCHLIGLARRMRGCKLLSASDLSSVWLFESQRLLDMGASVDLANVVRTFPQECRELIE